MDTKNHPEAKMNCVVVCGLWLVTGDGVWRFFVDIERVSRVVPMKLGMKIKDLVVFVMTEFDLECTSKPKLSCSPVLTLSSASNDSFSPIMVTTDFGLSCFLDILSYNRSMKLILSLGKIVRKEGDSAKKKASKLAHRGRFMTPIRPFCDTTASGSRESPVMLDDDTVETLNSMFHTYSPPGKPSCEGIIVPFVRPFVKQEFVGVVADQRSPSFTYTNYPQNNTPVECDYPSNADIAERTAERFPNNKPPFSFKLLDRDSQEDDLTNDDKMTKALPNNPPSDDLVDIEVNYVAGNMSQFNSDLQDKSSQEKGTSNSARKKHMLPNSLPRTVLVDSSVEHVPNKMAPFSFDLLDSQEVVPRTPKRLVMRCLTIHMAMLLCQEEDKKKTAHQMMMRMECQTRYPWMWSMWIVSFGPTSSMMNMEAPTH